LWISTIAIGKYDRKLAGKKRAIEYDEINLLTPQFFSALCRNSVHCHNLFVKDSKMVTSSALRVWLGP